MAELTSSSLEISKKFVPVREAAKRVSYTTDYVSRLAREGKITAKREGRAWLVELDSLKLFSLQAKADAIRKQEDLKQQRRLELATAKIASFKKPEEAESLSQTHRALLEAAALTICFSLVFLIVQLSLGYGLGIRDWQQGISTISERTQTAVALNSLVGFKLPDWLWLFKYEKTESLVIENEAANNDLPSGENLIKRRYPSQIDVSSGELLITRPVNEELDGSYVEDSFSDAVLLEFVNSRQGTVTAEFVSGETEDYPFRLVKAPVKPGTD